VLGGSRVRCGGASTAGIRIRRAIVKAGWVGLIAGVGGMLLTSSLVGFALAHYVEPADGPKVPNPCADQRAIALRCPDLKMRKPSGLYVTGNRLHAASNIRSRGEGPLEIRGKRSGPRSMRVNQVIYRRGGGHVHLPTNGHLVLYNVPGQGPYWKFHHAASFELRTVGEQGEPDELVRTGPKVNYCIRDLARTKPSKRSPRRAVYPGCSQDPHIRRRTLGISPGWSDIYPADYDKNWIGIGGLRGCYWFIQRADPENYLYESNEQNNAGMRRIKLPARHGRVRHC
jgi:hypothetical protein